MLTKDDLFEIKKLLQEETRLIIQEEISPLKNEFIRFKKEVKSEFHKVKLEFRKVKRDLKNIRGNLNIAIKLFDNDIYDVRTRVDRIEDHLSLSPHKT